MLYNYECTHYITSTVEFQCNHFPGHIYCVNWVSNWVSQSVKFILYSYLLTSFKQMHAPCGAARTRLHAACWERGEYYMWSILSSKRCIMLYDALILLIPDFQKRSNYFFHRSSWSNLHVHVLLFAELNRRVI